jgi:hypothetical protein
MNEAPAVQNLLAGKLALGITIFERLADRDDDPLPAFIGQRKGDLRASHLRALPPGFALTRRLYRSMHIDPTKHRPSSEALWRRLRDKGDFPVVNPLVDLTNLLSLEFQVCYGLYDLDHVHGPVTVTLGDENDQYPGIRKETLNFKGQIVLRDERGAFGNPSADSLRACVSENSRRVMQVLFFHPDDGSMEKILSATLAALRRFFVLERVQSFLSAAHNKQGTFPGGETCKTSESWTPFPKAD